MAQTVYGVARGAYSDYGICAVFSTKEKAEEYIRHESDPAGEAEPYFIEEFELDPVTAQRTWRNAWEVALDLETGNRLLYYNHTAKKYREETTKHTRSAGVSLTTSWWMPGLGRKTNPTAVATSYVSEDHAWKLAAEARQKWLREGKPEIK